MHDKALQNLWAIVTVPRRLRSLPAKSQLANSISACTDDRLARVVVLSSVRQQVVPLSLLWATVSVPILHSC